MKRKFLIFVYGFIVWSIVNFSSVCFADIPESPPPLPALEFVSGNEEKSFWDKILEFFGLADNKEQQSKEPSQETTQIKENQAIEVSTESSADSITPQIYTAKETADDLKLPEGFAPDEYEHEQSVNAEIPAGAESGAESKAEIPASVESNTESQIEMPSQTGPDSSKSDPEADSGSIVSTEPTVTGERQDSRQDIILQLPPAKETLALQEDASVKASSLNIPASEAPVQAADSVAPTPETGNSEVSQYRKHLQERLNREPLPIITEEDRITTEAAASNSSNDNDKNIDPKQLKFINDEVQVLILPNDDFVLGKLTEKAQLEMMDFRSYVKIFWDNYNLIKNEPARRAIHNFIDAYDNKKSPLTGEAIKVSFISAIEAIENHRIYDLIKLVDNYPILNMIDQNGDNLLHKAIYNDNYPAVKLLLMKGIDFSHVNYKGLRAIDVAITRNKVGILTLLRSAGL